MAEENIHNGEVVKSMKKGPLRMVGGILFNLFLYVAIVVSIVFGLPKYLSWQFGTEYPMAAITSGSMWPVLHTGDFTLIRAVPQEIIAVGDIVVWKNEKGFTIHRVVKLDKDTLTTKGDANFTEDPPVRYQDVVGRVVMFFGKPTRIPYLGYISMIRAEGLK